MARAQDQFVPVEIGFYPRSAGLIIYYCAVIIHPMRPSQVFSINVFQFSLRIGKGSSIKYLVLQVHYGKLDNLPSSGDDSGVFLQFTEKPQPKVAGVLLLGTGGLAPPHSTTFFETACEIDDPRVIHPFAYRVHTHSLGKVVSGWRVQGKSKWDLIGKKNPQQPQMFYPVEHEENVLTAGDVIAARCTMVISSLLIRLMLTVFMIS